MKKFNWKAAIPAFLTAASWVAVGIMWGFGVPMTFYNILAPLIAQATGIILGIIWTPAPG